jgi:hypothetical protein
MPNPFLLSILTLITTLAMLAGAGAGISGDAAAQIT